MHSGAKENEKARKRENVRGLRFKVKQTYIFINEKLEEAREILQKVVSDYPEFYLATYYLALTYDYLGRLEESKKSKQPRTKEFYDKAEKFYQKTIKLEYKLPDSPLFEVELEFQTVLDSGKISEAQQKFKGNGIPLSERIIIKKEGTKWLITNEVSKQVYSVVKEEQVKLNVYYLLRDASVYYSFGDFLYQQGKDKEAFQMYNKALEIDPDHPKPLQSRQLIIPKK